MSIMKVVAMTIGEIEYTRFFTDQQLFSPVLSSLVFLAFCVMMPIVLMNLTVSFLTNFTKSWSTSESSVECNLSLFICLFACM